MKMPNITPGPWSRYMNKMNDFVIRKIGDSGFELCVIAKDVNYKNSTAIAALPDVLEALIEIVNAADGAGWDQLDAGFTKARGALLKAGCIE